MPAEIFIMIAPSERLTVSAYRMPTDFPESEGALAWSEILEEAKEYV